MRAEYYRPRIFAFRGEGIRLPAFAPEAAARPLPRIPAFFHLCALLPMTEHIHFFEGGNALSEFRARQLLPRLQAVAKGVAGVQARFVHVAAFEFATF